MVDCVYYENIDIDKEAVKKQFVSKFGEKYNLHQGICDEKYIITADDIVNIKPKVYAEIVLGLHNKHATTISEKSKIKSGIIFSDHIYERYYNSLSLLAMIHEANPASVIEELEGHPTVLRCRKLLSNN